MISLGMVAEYRFDRLPRECATAMNPACSSATRARWTVLIDRPVPAASDALEGHAMPWRFM